VLVEKRIVKKKTSPAVRHSAAEPHLYFFC